MRVLLTLLCLLLALPVLGVLGAWLAFDAQAWALLVHQAQTVLAGYALQSLLLAVFVGAGVALLGGGAAAAVALFEFPGRRVFEWSLLLPMAMPAFVIHDWHAENEPSRRWPVSSSSSSITSARAEP